MESLSSAQLALTDIYPPAPIGKPRDFKSAIENRVKALRDGSTEDSYLSFNGVTPQLFEYIESRRHTLGAKRARFTYFADIETLIVKVPSEAHEKAHAIIGHEIFFRLRRMGIAPAEVILGGSSKEVDSAYKNLNVRSQVASWPIWVVEGGMSKSLERLRGDASWWINHSKGEVQLVILVWICPSRRTVKVETWVPERRPPSPAPGPCTRARGAIPTLGARKEDDEVEMNFSANTPTYQGPPALVFQFSRLVGRTNPPGEHDVVFTRQELLRFARAIWCGII
ncbi:hypothetical protein Asppvi_003568 [Aspergillus pseudoviridinutans]|uniref:Uncharacterized protein n=1 Tax=Aspergillus pseudoviridinutans TaxID=1517512 RepID=A0A9P3B4Q5_9EURO|nr:uncharacterized protein Asppvi_003568 [Aspergillus pseudoviridinutans]GIJ84717.1 hypothetical protein Asppvi_003568 [Aspergillus pseudoviridinutans]